MDDVVRSIVAVAAADFRRLWSQLALTTIVYKVVAFLLLTPLVGLLLRVAIATSGSAAVADEEILFFLLSPVGLVGLIVIGAAALAIIAFEQASLMAVGFGALRERRVTYGMALRYVGSMWRQVLILTARIIGEAVAWCAPFLAVGGGVYLWLLTEYDINYYLSQTPREFWLAAGLVGAVVGAMAAVLVYRSVGWLISLPILMFEQVTPHEALKSAATRVAGRRREATWLIVAWAALAAVLSFVPAALVAWIGRTSIGLAGDSTALLMLAIAVVLLIWASVGQIATFINGAALALLVAGFYERARGPEAGLRGWQTTFEELGDSTTRGLSRGAVVIVCVVGLVASLAFSFALMQGLAADSDIQITAHRGAAMWAPENTLAAMERAIDDGADFVEIDVQETRDGTVVVLHDSDFMKLAGVNLKIWDAEYSDLSDIDIGSWFAPEFGDQRVPTLREVLDVSRDRVGVNIELKYYGHDQMLEQRVVDIVEAAAMSEQVVVMSLKYEAVQATLQLRPEWTVGLLTAVAIGDLTRLDADFLAVNTGLATRPFVRAAHAAGKKVFVWTVNDPRTAYAMISRGADGIITDDPAMAREVLAAFDEMTGIERLLAEVAMLVGIVEIEDDEPQEVG